MAEKKTGISRDLLIHPGETIDDVLKDRNITQAELATRTGVSPAYVSKVISGKKDISAKFAHALEYALGIPASFWMNLQANYDTQRLELDDLQTITEEERVVREKLKDVVKYLREKKEMPEREKKDDSIISLRKALQMSDLGKLKEVVSAGVFRKSEASTVDPYVMGAWVRLCQISADSRSVTTRFDSKMMPQLVNALKEIMLDTQVNIQKDLRDLMAQYGIDFSIMKNFRGAPVQGYLSLKTDGSYQMVLTIRGAYADIFWFSLFHELGHIMRHDIGKTTKFIDVASDQEKENAADLFAANQLLNPSDYREFVQEGNFSIVAIEKFAERQRVKPFIVIGRLQKEKKLNYNHFNEYKVRYKWTE